MTQYFSHGVKLNRNQMEMFAKDIDNNCAITIRLNKSDLQGPFNLMLTKTQLNKVKKAIRNNTGVDIKITKTQIRHAMKTGGNLFSCIASLGYKNSTNGYAISQESCTSLSYWSIIRFSVSWC